MLVDTDLQHVGSMPANDYGDLLTVPVATRTIVDTDRFGGRRANGHRRLATATSGAQRHRRTSAQADARIAKITRDTWVWRTIFWHLDDDKPRDLGLTWHSDQDAHTWNNRSSANTC